ncbi:MAG: AI-2E family transporter [Flavobacteriaceae bacterium]|nr:AI-2E family transporter [Flavobacteriaceae bacterium]MDZ4149202.1 AI-2E family transporter [Flavobacteriaceae bacterium]
MQLKFPFLIRWSILLLGLYVFVSILSIGQDIILPLIYAILIAILMSPLVGFLVRKRINHMLAISLVLLISFLVLAGFVLLFISQADLLREAWPRLSIRFADLFKQTVGWVSDYTNLSRKEINVWIDLKQDEFLANSSSAIGDTLNSVSGLLATAFLTPVYVFMLLYYQSHLVKFIHLLCGSSNDSKVGEILIETKGIVQSYLVGLFFEFIILAVLNTGGLLILGIPYAVLLGILGAFLNVIPYVGGVVTMLLFMAVALITQSPIYVFYVLALYSVIQFIDNNYIVPKIVGSKVKLNALISVIAVIAGAALWGLPGMLLSIPLIAILKLILDRIDYLKPWGFLLGENEVKVKKSRRKFLKSQSYQFPSKTESLTV